MGASWCGRGFWIKNEINSFFLVFSKFPPSFC